MPGVPVPEQTAAGAVGCDVIAGALLTVTDTALDVAAGKQVR